MATDSIVQFVESGFNRVGISETFLAAGAVGRGDWVMFDITKTGADQVLYVKKATATLAVHVVGVALGAAADGERVDVAISGYVAYARIANAVTTGQPLTISAVDGIADAADATDIVIAGASASGGNSDDEGEVIVHRKF